MSIEPFNRLVKLAARAFYDDYTTKGDNQPKIARSDNRGMAVVILDALTRRQWVREEDLAKDLKIHTKQLRRTLRFFEEEKLVTRDHKGAKLYSAAVAATTEVQNGKEGEDKVKLHTHSYCCLDYAQIYDVVRYRLHRLKKKLKDELDEKNTIQEYVCDEFFHCENCNGELVAESDKLTVQDGDTDDNARRRRREKLKDLLQKMETQLKPLTEQLNRVKDIQVPDFGNLLAWEARANAAGRALNGSSSNDPSKASQGYGAPLPFLGETKVEVAFSGADGKEEDSKSENVGSGLKVLPPWMIKQGMNLTKEQRGEIKQESKMDGSSSSAFSDDKKSAIDEYVKAYYAAILKQQELEAAKKQEELLNAPNLNVPPPESSPERQVGMKFKREEEEGDDGDDFWEDGANSANEGYRLNDLNEEAKATPEDEEDDIDWEEG
ncbi:General transcription factor IIE subunit 1 [Linum perenne]